MFEKVLNSQENNHDLVIKACTNKTGEGVCYQKHMVHHLLPSISKEWILSCKNCFLIRKPEDVISSFLDKWPVASFEDFGFKEQFDLFNYLKNNTGEFPLVVDADDLRNNTKETLIKLCNGLNIEWDPLMLSWEPGLKEYDGVWAKHWYPSVMSSSSFKPKSNNIKIYSKDVIRFSSMANDYYEDLFKNKI
jgi:hypothetical protein